MRKFSFKLFFAAAALVVAAACAKREDLDTSALEIKSFEAWVNKNLKDIPVVKQDNGMYVEFLNDNDLDEDLLAPADSIVWIRINYTVSTLSNDVFVTRSEAEALIQGSYTLYTHYIPDYVFCGDDNQSMIAGQYYALKKKLTRPDGTETILREGSKVRLYLPSTLAFGSAGYSNDQGYGGQYALTAAERPVIEELEIVEVVKNPIKREEDLVHRFAQERWGLNEERDTIATCLYLDSLPPINDYPAEHAIKYPDFIPNLAFKPNLEDAPEYALTADSTAKIWFVKRFLDGFIADTNIEPIYREFHSRQPGYMPDEKSFTVFSYTPESDKDSEIAAFFNIVPAIRKGMWYRAVFPSSYAYGVTGQSKALQDYLEYYDQLMAYYSSYSTASSYGYGSSYYDSYGYNSYYGGYDYYNYSTSSTDKDTIVTEIQSYTPLILEIYIEPEEE